MLYLSGTNHSVIADDLRDGSIGLLNTPVGNYGLDRVAVWAMDNGCFTGKYPGDEAYLRLLRQYRSHQQKCLFVSAPDVVGDPYLTRARFQPVATALREQGWSVAFVGQDGMEWLPVPWDELDWLFIGGSTDWKMGEGAYRLIRQARDRGKRVHVGRVNSLKRFMYFHRLGCDTADGTHITFNPTLRAEEIRQWSAIASRLQITR